ncbi:MAG: hypothetical protein U0835_19455 [Isosphaeraceae bacterium]
MQRKRPSPRPIAWWALWLLLPVAARAAGPADPLLRLVPADAGVTLAVENLKGHVRTLADSPTARALRDLPVVRGWRRSPTALDLGKSVRQVEALLETDIGTVRDALLGEAVVLSLRPAPDAAPDEARGLLLAKVSDRSLLERFVSRLNEAQTRSGELRSVGERERGGVKYHVRTFAPGMRPDESYVLFEDGVFVWSNSEELVRGAIDRKSSDGKGGLAERPGFARVRERLPANALASLFVDPRFAERVLAATPPPAKPQEKKVFATIVDYLGALNYAGAALSWRNGPLLVTEEVVEPDKLHPGLTRWAAQTEPVDPRLHRAPSTALALATVHLDFPLIVDSLSALVPETDRPALDNLMVALRGGMLGLEPRDEVAAHLGPGVALYMERPAPRLNEGSRRPPLVMTVQVASTPAGVRAASAVDNALRTVFALAALDPKNGRGKVRVETRTEGGTVVTLLPGPQPLAYAVHDGRVILATAPKAVGRAIAAQADPKGAALVERLRSLGMPATTSFACADLRTLFEFADPNRQEIASRIAARDRRSEADAARDLDQVLALVRLFEGAYLTSSIDPGFTRVTRTLGLPARTSDAP